MYNSCKKSLLPTIVMLALLTLLAISSYNRNITWDDSVSLWGDVAAKSPMKARAHYNLATVVVSTGEYDRALKENLLALKLNPALAGAHFNIGAINHVQGNIDEAILRYKTAIKFRPDDAKAHNNIAVAYRSKGLDSMALKEFSITLAINPNHMKAYLSRGNLYLDIGEAQKAYADFMRILSVMPEHAEAILGAGIALEMMGKKEEAGQKYKLASKYRATGTVARQRLNNLYSTQTWGKGIRYESRPAFSRPRP